VIRLPLTNDVFFNLYHVLHHHIKVIGTDYKFIFIQPEQDYMLMDNAKRHFTKLGVHEFHECNSISKNFKICKHTQPVQLTHLDEVCVDHMIETIRSITASCSQRIVELNHTFWTDRNEWLFVKPISDVLSVVY